MALIPYRHRQVMTPLASVLLYRRWLTLMPMLSLSICSTVCSSGSEPSKECTTPPAKSASWRRMTSMKSSQAARKWRNLGAAGHPCLRRLAKLQMVSVKGCAHAPAVAVGWQWHGWMLAMVWLGGESAAAK